MATRISIGISPCPNDTYIFYALLTGKVIVPDLEFEVFMEDVERLNRWALDSKLDITKLSFNAYAHVLQTYILLNSGAALGNGCGPLLISRPGFTMSSIMDARIAIPGYYTTAYFLLRLLYPELKHVEVCLFSEIEDKICSEQVDAGLIIHENRFTYQEKGLISLIDLGEYWENLTWLPIPLGGIIAKRNISVEILKNIEVGIKKSLEYAYAHEDEVLNYCAQYAQTMTRDVMLQHIRLYVNEYTLNLGEVGITAVKRLLDMAVDRNIIATYNQAAIVL